MKSQIKILLRESLNEIEQSRLTVNYFKERVPFLRDSYQGVETDKVIQIHTTRKDHSDAMIHAPNADQEFIKFKYFKTGVNFEYRKGLVSGNPNDIIHVFELIPMVIMEPISDNKVFVSVFQRVMDEQMRKLGTEETIQLPKGKDIPDEEMDKVVNNMNKTFFEFEEFLKNYGIESL